MEAKNMATPENARRGISTIGAPTREAPTPVLPRPEVRPVPVPPEQKPPTKKPLIQRLAGNLALRVLLAGTAVAGTGYAAYQEIPAVHRAADNLIGTDTIPSVPTAFDNNADKGVIEENNIIRVLSEEVSKLPSFTSDGKPILLFPIQNISLPTTIEYGKELSAAFFSKETLDKAEQEGIKNRFEFTVPTGTLFTAPIDGHAFIWNVEQNGEIIPVGVSLTFMSTSNTLYGFSINTEFPQGSGIQKAIDVLVDATIKGPQNSNGREWQKGLPITRDTPLFKTTQNVNISLTLIGSSSGVFGPDEKRILTDIIFATDPSTNKLIVANQ